MSKPKIILELKKVLNIKAVELTFKTIHKNTSEPTFAYSINHNNFRDQEGNLIKIFSNLPKSK